MSVCQLYLNVRLSWNRSLWLLLIPDPHLPVRTVRNRATLLILFFASPSQYHYLIHGEYWCQRDRHLIPFCVFWWQHHASSVGVDMKADWSAVMSLLMVWLINRGRMNIKKYAQTPEFRWSVRFHDCWTDVNFFLSAMDFHFTFHRKLMASFNS